MANPIPSQATLVVAPQPPEAPTAPHAVAMHIIAFRSRLQENIQAPLTELGKLTLDLAAAHYATVLANFPPITALVDTTARAALRQARAIVTTAQLQVACLQGNLGEIRELLRTTETTVTPLAQICPWSLGKYAPIREFVTHTELLQKECCSTDQGNVPTVETLLQQGASLSSLTPDGYTALHLATESNRPDLVRLLLAHGACPDTPTLQGGATPLHVASFGGFADVVAELLAANAAVDIPEMKEGCTPLHIAAKRGHAGITGALLDAGASASARDAKGWAALHCAVNNGHLDVVRLLATHDIGHAKAPNTPLHIAALRNQTAILDVLLQAGAAVDAPNMGGLTPLHTAAECGHLAVVERLLRAGAPINMGASEGGATPLHVASFGGFADVVAELLAANAAVDIPEMKEGCTPLHIAAKRGHAGITGALLDAGASASARDAKGWAALHCAVNDGHLDVVRLLATHDIGHAKAPSTPLHIAALRNQPAILDVLLQAGAAVDAPNMGGLTPLHTAAECGHLAVVERLLRAGAPINMGASDGSTPLIYAITKGRLATAHLLIERGANVNAVHQVEPHVLTALYAASRDGYTDVMRELLLRGAAVEPPVLNDVTALHTAAQFGRTEAMRLLLQYGANCNAAWDGLTPLHLASIHGQLAAVRLLLEHGAARHELTRTHETALDRACIRQHVEVAQLLLSYDSLLPKPLREQLCGYALHQEHLATARPFTQTAPCVPDAPISDLLLLHSTLQDPPEGQLQALEAVTRRIAKRTPDVGTPKEGSEALEAFYVNIERLLTNVIAVLKRSANTAEISEALVAITDVDGWCGGTLVETSFRLYNKHIRGLHPSLENDLAQLLADYREHLLRSCVRDIEDEHNRHQYMRLLYALGREFAIPAADMAYEDNILRHNSIEEARTRMLARYTPLGIIEDCLLPRLSDAGALRDKFFDWCKAHIPADFEPGLPTDERELLYLERHVVVDMGASPMRIQPLALLALLEQCQIVGNSSACA